MRAARGIPNQVPAQPATEIIQRLLSIGFTLHSIAAAAGVSVSAVRQICHGTYANANIDVVSRIVAVTHKPVPAQSGQRVPSIGVGRRVHALQAIGWTRGDIGSRLGVSGSAVTAYTHRFRLSYEVWKAVADLYEQMSGAAGPSEISRWRAKGFAPPLAWEGLDIDDPDRMPVATKQDKELVDEVLVARILKGGYKAPISRLERAAVMDHALAHRWPNTRVAEVLNVRLDSASRAIIQHRSKNRGVAS